MNESKPAFIDRIARAARSPFIYPALLLIEILETTFVPIPYEAILIALVLAAPERLWQFVAVSVLGSVIGGLILYFVGAGMAEPVAAFVGVESEIATYRETFEQRGGALIFLAAVTPIPGYIVNIVAGASGYPVTAFLILIGVGRFLRFAVIGWLVARYGTVIVDRWMSLPRRLRWTLLAALLVAATWWSLASLS